MAGRADDIEVVVLRAGDAGDADEADAADGFDGFDGFDGGPCGGRRRRRWGAALAALAVVVVTLVAPVARGRPAEEGASPRMQATEVARCPGSETRRLWCSFVTDRACCPPDQGRPEPPPSRGAVD